MGMKSRQRKPIEIRIDDPTYERKINPGDGEAAKVQAQ
jgi:hypothetical protein